MNKPFNGHSGVSKPGPCVEIFRCVWVMTKRYVVYIDGKYCVAAIAAHAAAAGWHRCKHQTLADEAWKTVQMYYKQGRSQRTEETRFLEALQISTSANE